ncbi:OmpA family protein [Marimonas lutisalis]|uniref:OmpA family protein n=1 Tax=Marimonas lutisalis TaxID=2545756 RepID=UPI0010F9D81B|nr:OmpA family protein [Marimonas lutisalis]
MKQIIAPIALLALAGCAVNTPGGQSFFREAGANIDSGYFGNATMNNTQIMSGEKSYVYSLASRFAQEVPSTVNFAFDSAVLDPGARDVLRQQAQWIRQFPEIRFRVYGHTDLVGSNAYNKSLGLRRAKAVVSFLASQGISRSRLEAVASYGETQPLIVTEGRERRNRRTVTEVTGFVRNHPSVLDGKYAEVIYREYIASGVPRTTLTGISGSDFQTTE